MWKMYRVPSIRVRHRKYWAAFLVVAAGAVAALLVLGLSAGRSAKAQTASAVVVGAGDISRCDTTGDTATAKLLDSIAGTVIALGDNAYEEGSLAQYNDCYGPTWGRHITRTRPAVGNHEYRTGPYPPERPATSATSAPGPESPPRATIPTTGAPGTSSC